MNPRSSSGAGVSVVEAVVAAAVLAAVGIPLLSLLFQTRANERMARHEYLALVAARDVVAEAQLLAHLGRADDATWALEGSVLGRLRATATEPSTPVVYRPDQRRLKARLEQLGGEGRVRAARVRVAWDAPAGEAAGEAERAVEVVFGMRPREGGPQ